MTSRIAAEAGEPKDPYVTMLEAMKERLKSELDETVATNAMLAVQVQMLQAAVASGSLRAAAM